MSKLTLVMIALFISISSLGYAEQSYFLKPGSVNVNAALPPPPNPDSPEAKKDFQILLERQNSRTADDCKRAQSEASASLKSLFGPPFGPLTSSEVEKLLPFYDKVFSDSADLVIHPLKTLWARPRPYLTDPKLTPCVTKEFTYAYPSGHATIAVLFSKILSQIYPERAKLFLARGIQIGEDRVLGGLHHPADIQAGGKVAELIFTALQKKPLYLQEIESLKPKSIRSSSWPQVPSKAKMPKDGVKPLE